MTKRTKAIQDELQSSARQIWFAGLGALATAEEEGTKVFKNLVKKGEKYEVPGSQTVGEGVDAVKKSVKKARSKAENELGKKLSWVEDGWERVEDRIDDTVTKTLQKMGVPSRDEVKKLTLRVEQLTKKVESLKPARKTAAKKTKAKRKTSATKTAKRTTKKARTRKAS